MADKFSIGKIDVVTEMGKIIQVIYLREDPEDNGIVIRLNSGPLLCLPLEEIDEKLGMASIEGESVMERQAIVVPRKNLWPNEGEECLVRYEIDDSGLMTILKIGLFLAGGVSSAEVRALKNRA